MAEESYDGIIKDINDQDTDMPTIMFDPKKKLGKSNWKSRKTKHRDDLIMRFSIQTGEEALDELYKRYIGK